MLDSSWRDKLKNEFSLPYFKSLLNFIENEYIEYPESVFPKRNQLFRAFEACPFDKVKVVVLGQDPYPTKGHANGLCFSVEPDVRPLPKSLKNIYEELESDLGLKENENGDLNRWAKQGVLLLNATLTVREGEPESHANKGWEKFTNAVIEKLNIEKSGIVYILWGSKAKLKAANVNRDNNFVIESSHPSPLSSYRGFFGSKPFSKTNTYLESRGEASIKW